MKSYKEKLEDERWKQKRDKIIKRDGGCCKLCASDKDLHVHHILYYGEPWDVFDKHLVTLCAECHHFIESFKKYNRLKEVACLYELDDDDCAFASEMFGRVSAAFSKTTASTVFHHVGFWKSTTNAVIKIIEEKK
jgi:hypothetical protein